MFFSIRGLFAPKETQFRIAECADGMYRVQSNGMTRYEGPYYSDDWHTLRIRVRDQEDEGRQYAVYETLQQAKAFETKVRAYEKDKKASDRRANTVVKVY